MTAPAEPLQFQIAPRRRRPRRDWRRALRALRELLGDPDRTSLAFEVTLALDPDHGERILLRMLRHPEGRRVFAERPDLCARLCDRDALAALPEDSLGRAYLAHLDRHGLEPAKLVELGRENPPASATDASIRWMVERNEMTHDLWHALTGYGADPLGESALLAFSQAQIGGAANLLLAIGANLRVGPEQGPGWIPYVFKAWRRGRRATCLSALPWEDLLCRPLAEVRDAAGVEPPERAHPGGVARSEDAPTAA